MEPTPNLAVTPKPRQTMLPLLLVLLLISYALLTTLVVFQDRTIDSQRSLIHLLFKDNLHLLASKAGLHGVGSAQASQKSALTSMPRQTAEGQSPAAQAPSKPVPAAKTPSAQVPSTQIPVIQAKPEASAKVGQKSKKARKALPLRPPAEVTDPSDTRRVSISI